MKQIQKIRLFISCPGDIKEEINSVNLIAEEINKTSGRQNDYMLECLHWKLDTYTEVAEDPQEVINNQLDKEYDILVGLVWQKIGSPTKRDKSGTIEEISRAILNKKKLLIYFKTAPPENLNMINLEELSKVNDFKKELSTKGVLYKEFNSIDSFESLFRINIINLIGDQILPKVSQTISLDITAIDKYAAINELLVEVENKKDDTLIDLDIFELIEKTMSAFDSVTRTVDSMATTVNDLTVKMQHRTKELNTYTGIKDERLRMNKVKIVINLFASELDEFNARINNELPTFSENFLPLGPAYAKIFFYASQYDIPETEVIKQSAISFKHSVADATQQVAGMLREVMKWPSTNSKFNKSKRETEITLKNLTKEMLEGLKLLDEAIQE